jgi:hypothetical protein
MIWRYSATKYKKGTRLAPAMKLRIPSCLPDREMRVGFLAYVPTMIIRTLHTDQCNFGPGELTGGSLMASNLGFAVCLYYLVQGPLKLDISKRQVMWESDDDSAGESEVSLELSS